MIIVAYTDLINIYVLQRGLLEMCTQRAQQLREKRAQSTRQWRPPKF